MDDVQKAALGSVFRTLLAVAGGALVTHGFVNDAQWAQISGALVTLAPLVWGIVDKKISERKTQDREAAAYAAGTTTLKTTEAPTP